jgi:hypothetical protein
MCELFAWVQTFNYYELSVLFLQKKDEVALMKPCIRPGRSEVTLSDDEFNVEICTEHSGTCNEFLRRL